MISIKSEVEYLREYVKFLRETIKDKQRITNATIDYLVFIIDDDKIKKTVEYLEKLINELYSKVLTKDDK